MSNDRVSSLTNPLTAPVWLEKTFVWEYYDKDKAYRRIPENTADGISPLDFYKQIVKPIFNMEDKLCLVNDPRATSPYYRLIKRDCMYLVAMRSVEHDESDAK